MFQNRWVLITGASSGIGRAFAECLAERGARLVLCARNESALEELSDTLCQRPGAGCLVIPTDLTQAEQRKKLLGRIELEGIELSHLLNNAAFGTTGAFHESNVSEQLDLVHLNVEAVVQLTHAVLPAMVRRGSGGVLNVASVVAFSPLPYMAVYGASKAFVLSFTEALAEELRGTGVRAMALCPGAVPTGFQQRAGYELDRALRSVAMPARSVAEQAIAAYESGATLCTPGLVNRLHTGAIQLLPRALVRRATAIVNRRIGRGND